MRLVHRRAVSVIDALRRRALPSPQVRIDHVIYATADLGAAADRLQREHGLVAIAGGRHDGMGTHNRIVPLAQGYVELLAVADAREAAGSALGAALLARLRDAGEGLMGWAVAVEDVRPVAERLGTELIAITRQGLSAHLTGVAESLREPCLPFFIARGAGTPGPPRAERDRDGISWIEVAGDARRLEQWLGAAELPLRIVDGTPAVRAVGIGERELRFDAP